jgi:hypothetical protein
MGALETDLELAAEIARIKSMAIQRCVRSNWTFGAALIAAVVIGVAVWFIQKPMDRDEIHVGLAVGLGLATLLFGSLLCRFLFPIPSAECPKCGCDWNIESENDMQKWLRWHSCPGCGLKMSDDTGLHEKP